MSATQENNAFKALQVHKCISLTTFRKNGKAVPTPVQFAVEDGKLYVSTRTHSGKVKRIRNNPNVQLAPCTMRGKIVGPTIEAVARILSTQEEEHAKITLKRKYGWQMRWGSFIDKLRRHKRVYLEIVPAKTKTMLNS